MTEKKAELALISVSIGWGTSYLLMKIGLDGTSPFNLIALRFGIAFIITFFIFFKRIKCTNIRTVFHSLIIGAFLFFMFSFLLFGLRTTTASSAGFLIGTTVAFVPIIQAFIKRQIPELKTIICTTMVLMGIGFITLKNGFLIDSGSILCLIGAIFNALYIIITNTFVKSDDTLQIGIFQLGFASLFGIIFSFIFEIPKLPQTMNSWIAILGLAIICSAYGFVMQPIAQKYVAPENVGFIFSLEPVFSSIFAFIFYHEILNREEYFGAILILISILIASNSSNKFYEKMYTKLKIKIFNKLNFKES